MRHIDSAVILIDRPYEVQLPAGTQVVDVAVGRYPGALDVQLISDPDRPPVWHRFRVVGDGDSIDDGETYLGTAHSPTGPLHLILTSADER